ncbi:MFS transporter [Nonomuraea sediminis]|uniref:MFS transporter n=1 Tax=Nonomuraea sediminis TaxID=2835864 RepID=UPI001BDC14C3|nr:MFS transporter [Nonomuraea sediminis]
MTARLYPLALGNFATGTGMFVTAGLLAPISRDLGVSLSAAGQLMTVFAISYAILSPLLAALTARLSRKRVLLIALAFFVVGNTLTALAPTYPLVMLTRVVAAAGGAMFTPTASGVATALSTPERRGRALALVMGGLTVSSAIGVPLGTWLGTASGWRSTMWLVVGLGVIGLIGVAAAVPDVTIATPGRLRERFAPLGDRRVLAVLTTQLLMFCAAFAAYTYIGSLLDVPLPAVLWAWGIGGVIGNQIGGRLTDAFGPRRMVLLGLTSATVILALIPVANLSLPIALVWGLAWGVLGWLIAPAQQYRTVGAVPGNVAIGLGLLSSAQYVGVFVAGIAGGVALDAFGRTGVIVLSTAVALLALVFTLITYRPVASKEPEPVR